MMFFLLFACAGEKYALPEAEVFYDEEEGWEGTLSFVSFEGDREECSMFYTMNGEERDCTDCIWEVGFELSPVSESCIYSELEFLTFRLGVDYQWLVQEKSGWEEWGVATEENNSWSFVSSHRFLP